MKHIRKRKAVVYAECIERFHNKRRSGRTEPYCPERKLVDVGALMQIETQRCRRRIDRESDAMLREMRRRRRAGIRQNLNYGILVAADSDLPRAGGQFGQWLYLEAIDNDASGDRTVAILAGGPLHPPPGTERRYWGEAIDAWFCSPQEAFEARAPAMLIAEEGLIGIRRVAAALDAMAPDGPPWPIRKGRGSGR